jgi:hypothetical protein
MLEIADGTGKAAGFAWDCAGGGWRPADDFGADASPLGPVTGRFFVPREKYDYVLPAGDIGGSKCGAFDFAVYSEPVAEVMTSARF